MRKATYLSGFTHFLILGLSIFKCCAQPIIMLKIILLFLFLFVHGISPAQFKLNDTLFFLRDKNDEFYHRIFIDTNKRSEFYSYVSDFTIANFDIDTYKRSLKYLYSKKLLPKKQSVGNLPREWVLLETYKNNIYVYSPADFYFHYKVKLTDSLFIDWTGEGPEATYIQKFNKLSSTTYKFILKSQSSPHRELTIKYIDKEKGIAIFQNKYYDPYLKKMLVQYQLMGEVRKMKNIPLLVNTCDNQKQDEIEFDKIDYAKIFMNPK
ncbi:MAG: hypothetical protein V4539_22285 [Bacteroidota bacterium]